MVRNRERFRTFKLLIVLYLYMYVNVQVTFLCRHFDPFKDHWAVANSRSVLPWPKERHNMVCYKGNIYVVSGIAYKKFIGDRQYSEGEDEAVMTFPVDKSNVIDMRISGNWSTTLPPMPIPRACSASIVIGKL